MPAYQGDNTLASLPYNSGTYVTRYGNINSVGSVMQSVTSTSEEEVLDYVEALELNDYALESYSTIENNQFYRFTRNSQRVYVNYYANNENNYEKWLETNQKWLETAGFHTACLWNTTNKERFGRYMQTCGLQGVFDGFENNKERYEVGKDGEGVISIPEKMGKGEAPLCKGGSAIGGGGLFFTEHPKMPY